MIVFGETSTGLSYRWLEGSKVPEFRVIMQQWMVQENQDKICLDFKEVVEYQGGITHFLVEYLLLPLNLDHLQLCKVPQDFGEISCQCLRDLQCTLPQPPRPEVREPDEPPPRGELQPGFFRSLLASRPRSPSPPQRPATSPPESPTIEALAKGIQQLQELQVKAMTKDPAMPSSVRVPYSSRIGLRLQGPVWPT